MNTRTEQLIESFFANELSETEIQELRNQLANDPAAAAEFQWQQRLAGEVSKISLSGGIRNTNWKRGRKAALSHSDHVEKMLAAAAAMAVLVVAWLILSPDKIESVVADNYVHYPNKMPFRSLGGPSDSSDQVPQTVLDAFRLYDATDKPAEAARALAAIVAANPDRPDYRFYYGVALLGNGQYADAAAALRPVADSDDAYKTPALYYLGLALAATGDKAEAQKALEAYLASDEVLTYREQARNVLKALK